MYHFNLQFRFIFGVRVQEGQFYTSEPVGLPWQLTPVSQLSIWAPLSPQRRGSYLISHRSISGSLISHSPSEKWILFPSSQRGEDPGRRSPEAWWTHQLNVICFRTPRLLCSPWIESLLFCLLAYQRLLTADRHRCVLFSSEFASKCKWTQSVL